MKEQGNKQERVFPVIVICLYITTIIYSWTKIAENGNISTTIFLVYWFATISLPLLIVTISSSIGIKYKKGLLFNITTISYFGYFLLSIFIWDKRSNVDQTTWLILLSIMPIFCIARLIAISIKKETVNNLLEKTKSTSPS